MAVSSKVSARTSAQLKRYKSVLEAAVARDIKESDTSVIVVDMLTNVLGYDKFQHITTEQSIRGTYADLAIRVDDDVRFLVEVKAIGIALKDAHVKQAIDYGANEGIEWVVLTNGAVWRLYKIIFGQPIDKTMLFEYDLLQANLRDDNLIECYSTLSREAFNAESMSALLRQKQITNRFAIADLIMSEPVLQTLRREIRRLSPGLKVETDFLRDLIAKEVVKRELIESEEAGAARGVIKRLQRGQRKRANADRQSEEQAIDEPDSAPAVPANPSDVSAEPHVETLHGKTAN
jgi:hypothetical protein